MADEMIGKTVLGRYRVVARLAQGGMGIVYLARAEGAAGFAKPVVVKRVLGHLSGDQKVARLFVREARILSNLQHPNIVSVVDFGEEDDAYIMVLDYVRAYHLGLWLAHRQESGERLSVGAVLQIMIKVLDALDYAHNLKLPDGTALDIVHADISPGNILVDTDGQVKLLDFGIARMKGEGTQTTDSKTIRGKFAYLPIEALDGSPPTRSTDVYACGVTLYELLVGENPFSGVDETRTFAKVISHEPPPPSHVRSDLPADLDAIVMRAIHKDKAQRPATAKDFARELRRVHQLPDDEATSVLAESAKQDYAAMPMKLGASISDLESSWRNPPAAATTAAKHAAVTADAAPAATPQRSRMGLVIAVAIAVAVALTASITVAVVVVRQREGDNDPKIVVIEKSGGTGTSTQASATASPTASAADSAALTNGAAHDVAGHDAGAAKPGMKGGGGDPLSAALAKNQPEIETCFRDKAANISGTPEVSVRFTIDKEGTVQRAELSPTELAQAPLGQCILSVAKKTRFPSQGGPATFRIPLRARKLQ